MHKILQVMRREYLQSIRSKMFWIGTLIMPVFMFGMIAISVLAQLVSPELQKPLAVIDETGGLGLALAKGLAGHTLKDGSPEFIVRIVAPEPDPASAREELEPDVLTGELYGIVTIGEDLEGGSNFKLYRKSVGDIDTANTVRAALKDATIGLRLERSELDLDQEVLEKLVAPITLNSYQVTESGESKQKGFAQALIPTFAFVVILFMTLYLYGFSITRGIIQEKSTRIMEVLLGSMSPDQLMTGKILGIGLVGLTQISIYIGVGIGARIAATMLLAATNTLSTTLIEALALHKLALFVVFFLLGYFLFSTMFAIIGAVCNTEQDAQSLQFPVMMCLMVPYLLTFFFVKHPDSTASVVASFIPLFTPMIMFMRIQVLMPPAWQILLSILLTSASIYFMFKVAAKVFRIGTLMYGKRPTLREVLRWARA